MRHRSKLVIACVAIASGCLGSGYLAGGYPLLAVGVLIAGSFWSIRYKKLTFWPVSCLLVVYLILTAAGVIANLLLPLMVTGCTAALAGWELTIFNQNLEPYSLQELETPLERNHLRSLSIASGVSLLLVLGGIQLNMQFPFGITALLVSITMGGLVYGTQFAIKIHR